MGRERPGDDAGRIGTGGIDTTAVVDVLRAAGASFALVFESRARRDHRQLAGRIALEGELLFDDDPTARVRWVADTRKIWLDERPRYERAHREFLEAAARGR